jgi:hypothetical protein
MNKIKGDQAYINQIKKNNIYNDLDFKADRYKRYLQEKYGNILGINFTSGPFYGNGKLENFIKDPNIENLRNKKDADFRKVGILIADILCNK